MTQKIASNSPFITPPQLSLEVARDGHGDIPAWVLRRAADALGACITVGGRRLIPREQIANVLKECLERYGYPKARAVKTNRKYVAAGCEVATHV